MQSSQPEAEEMGTQEIQEERNIEMVTAIIYNPTGLIFPLGTVQTDIFLWLNDKSRMKREFHVRFCERFRGKFPLSTRPFP